MEKQIPNPLKEFIEDNLITDEGYRSKYAIEDIDEKIRPGIESLKRRYFIREEGEFIELTHDVIVTLVKSDREERRKETALAAAKKKAKRKVFFIASLAVLAVLAAFVGPGLLAKKTLEDQNRNIKEKLATASHALDNLGTSIDSIQQQIEDKQRVLDSLGNIRPGNKPDTSLDKLRNQIASDALLLASLNNKKVELEKMINDLNARNLSLRTNQERLELANSNLKANQERLEGLLNSPDRTNAQIQKLLERIRNDSIEFEGYKRKYPMPGISIKPRPDIKDENRENMLKVKFYFESEKNKEMHEASLTAYLIPDTRENKKIIKSAKEYQIHCNDSLLSSAKNYQVAKYDQGYYYFTNVTPGKYLIKVCTYYGGYYSYTKKENKNDILKLDAAPPIR